MTNERMETLREAMARLESAGFERAFRPTRDGLLELDGEGPIPPEDLVVEEVVRFEGRSDPEDQAVLFALRSQDGHLRGTFSASYGTQVDPDSAAVIQGLSLGPADRRAPGDRARPNAPNRTTGGSRRSG